jgi:hypothetical protein
MPSVTFVALLIRDRTHLATRISLMDRRRLAERRRRAAGPQTGLVVGWLSTTKKAPVRRQGPFNEVGDTGLEPAPKSPRETRVSDSGSSNSGNNRAGFGAPIAPERPADPDLAALVAAWPTLPSAVRVGIVAMVRAAAPPGASEARDGAKGEGDR